MIVSVYKYNCGALCCRKMNEELQEVKKEIAALKAEHYFLLDKEELSKSEQYKVDNFEKELTRLDDYRKTLVTALATAPRTQGTFELKG